MVQSMYRNAKAYGFCPGCGHRVILDALTQAFERLQWDRSDVILVTDIGCVGLSDQYFSTHAFHGLHGRSITYASGIKLAHPDKHVIVLIGDGGCGIGATHLVNAARRNIGVTTLVFNNLNFGMTGGEHSVTTPPDQHTLTTPQGHIERPLDIAQTAALNGATWAWRGTAYDQDLIEQMMAALQHDGFALMDIWELCVAYIAATNRINPRKLGTMIDQLGFQRGQLATAERQEYTAWIKAGQGAKPSVAKSAAPCPVREPASQLDKRFALILAGSAGGHIRTAGKIISLAAMYAGLHVTQRDDYPVTVRAGHSISEIILSPQPVHFSGVTSPTALFILTEDGYHKTAHYLAGMQPDSWVFVTPEYCDVQTPAQVCIFDSASFMGIPRNNMGLAQVSAGLHYMGVLPESAVMQAARNVSASYAEQNQKVVSQGWQASLWVS